MRRLKGQCSAYERCFSYTCNHFDAEFASSRAYTARRTHYTLQGMRCLVEANNYESTYMGLENLVTGILWRHLIGDSKMGVTQTGPF